MDDSQREILGAILAVRYAVAQLYANHAIGDPAPLATSAAVRKAMHEQLGASPLRSDFLSEEDIAAVTAHRTAHTDRLFDEVESLLRATLSHHRPGQAN